MSRFIEAAREAAERERAERAEAEKAAAASAREHAREHVVEVLGSTISDLGLTARRTSDGVFVWADGDVGVAAVPAGEPDDPTWDVYAVRLDAGAWARLGPPVASLADVGEQLTPTTEG